MSAAEMLLTMPIVFSSQLSENDSVALDGKGSLGADATVSLELDMLAALFAGAKISKVMANKRNAKLGQFAASFMGSKEVGAFQYDSTALGR